MDSYCLGFKPGKYLASYPVQYQITFSEEQKLLHKLSLSMTKHILYLQFDEELSKIADQQNIYKQTSINIFTIDLELNFIDKLLVFRWELIVLLLLQICFFFVMREIS